MPVAITLSGAKPGLTRSFTASVKLKSVVRAAHVEIIVINQM
jgi:hypothetical protein